MNSHDRSGKVLDSVPSGAFKEQVFASSFNSIENTDSGNIDLMEEYTKTCLILFFVAKETSAKILGLVLQTRHRNALFFNERSRDPPLLNVS